MENDRAVTLPTHCETVLGRITQGWSDRGGPEGIQVVCFEGVPEHDVHTYATLGLSRRILDQSSGKRIRQELLTSANSSAKASDVAALVLSIAEGVAERGVALQRGQIIGPGSSVIPDSPLSAVYITNPSPLPEALLKFDTEPATVFAYLVPLLECEAKIARSVGWRRFEELLEEHNPDVWNWRRDERIELGP